MKIAVLYICTGKYKVFWEEFYKSCEAFFIKNAEKEYFVFTDAELLFNEGDNRIHKYYKSFEGWPYETLKRFQVFSTVRDRLLLFDYIIFFNANALFVEEITAEEFLPSVEEKLVAVVHPGYYNVSYKKYPYEKSQKVSAAFVSPQKGKYYYQGCLNGGFASEYMLMTDTLKDNVQKDLDKGIIAIWHDESHLNKYLFNRNIKRLSPAYAFPEEFKLPFEKKILMRDKSKFGGHQFLRNENEKKRSGLKRLKGRLIGVFKKIFIKQNNIYSQNFDM